MALEVSNVGASPLAEGSGAFQIGDVVRFCHGKRYDEILYQSNRDYRVMLVLEDGKVAIAEANRPLEEQQKPEAQATLSADLLYLVKDHELNAGDVVTIPAKQIRREKQGRFGRSSLDLWVIVDASSSDEVALIRYSSNFDGLADFTKSEPVTWSWRKVHQIKTTDLDIFQYRDRSKKAVEKLEKQHDLKLEPTNARYVEGCDLDNLIAVAVQFFKDKGYESDYAGYSQGSWQVCVFLQNGDLVGSLLFDALPNFDDPNQNCPWLGGYKDFYWRADDELESEIYARDLVSDLERLAQPMQNGEERSGEQDALVEFPQPTPIVESLMASSIATLEKNGYQAQTAGYTYNCGGAWRVQVEGKGLDSQNAYYLRFEIEDEGNDKPVKTEYLGCYQVCWWRAEWSLNRHLQQNDTDTLQDLKALAVPLREKNRPFKSCPLDALGPEAKALIATIKDLPALPTKNSDPQEYDAYWDVQEGDVQDGNLQSLRISFCPPDATLGHVNPGYGKRDREATLMLDNTPYHLGGSWYQLLKSPGRYKALADLLKATIAKSKEEEKTTRS